VEVGMTLIVVCGRNNWQARIVVAKTSQPWKGGCNCIVDQLFVRICNRNHRSILLGAIATETLERSFR